VRNKNKRSGRKEGKRKSGQNILIVCEGETEKIYFQALKVELKLRTVRIKIEPNAGGHSQTVEKARSLRDERKRKVRKSNVLLEYDVIWCVFDAENPNHHVGDLEKAIHAANSLNFQLAISNPSFEIWYLWHFSNTGRYFEDGQAVKRALRDYIADYTETMNVFSIVFPLTASAMERTATKLDRTEQEFPNPSTYVYRLLCKAFFANQPFAAKSVEKNERCLFRIDTDRCRFCFAQLA